MHFKWAELINYLISLLVFVYAFFFLRNKQRENPSQKIMGMPIKTAFVIMYIGAACVLMLIVLSLTTSTPV